MRITLYARIFFLSFFLISLIFVPKQAMAMDSEEVYDSFTSFELSRLFETCSESYAQFVACEYGSDGSRETQYYLKVRSQYQDKYEGLVGDDKADPLEESSCIDEQVMIQGRPLEAIGDSQIIQSPWNKVLYLSGKSNYQINQSSGAYRGSGFLVAQNATDGGRFVVSAVLVE